MLGRRALSLRSDGAAGPAAGRGTASAAIRFWIGALVLALAVIPGGAAASQDAPPALVVLLASDRPSYGPGAAPTFTLAVDNPSGAAVTATFPSAQVYDVVVLAGEAEVWRWSAGRAFAAALAERSFPPGLTLLGREAWDGRDDAGAPLPPGTYRAVAELSTAPPLDGNPIEIVLTAP